MIRFMEELTKREQQVADLLAQGLSDSGIAGDLGIAVKTVHGYVGRVMLKMQIPNGGRFNRRVLVALAIASGPGR